MEKLPFGKVFNCARLKTASKPTSHSAVQPSSVMALDGRAAGLAISSLGAQSVWRSPNVEFMSGPIIGTTAAVAATSLASGMLSSSDGGAMDIVMGVNWMSVRRKDFYCILFRLR